MNNNPIIDRQPTIEPFGGFNRIGQSFHQQSGSFDGMRSLQMDIKPGGKGRYCTWEAEFDVELNYKDEQTGVNRLWKGIEKRGYGCDNLWLLEINDGPDILINSRQKAFSARTSSQQTCSGVQEIEIMDGRNNNPIGYITSASEPGCNCKTFRAWHIQDAQRQNLFVCRMQYQRMMSSSIDIHVVRVTGDEFRVAEAERKFISTGCLSNYTQITARIPQPPSLEGESLPITAAVSDRDKRLIITSLVWMARVAHDVEAAAT